VFALLLIAAIQFQGGVFRVSNWSAPGEPPDGWQTVFAVYAGRDVNSPALLGAYTVESGELVFRPRFPLAPGMHVRAVFHPPGEPDSAIESAFDIPAAPALTPTTRVSEIYPTTSLLPANTLKLYIYFSAPMRRGDSWRHLRLVRDDGAVVDYPFLELDQELWDRDYRRFTVLFDPGRIKRGLASRAEAGPALEPGRTYTLIVDPAWQDGNGAPLVVEYRKTFKVAADLRVPPDPKKWRVTPPRANTRDPLVLSFGRPLDYALLQHEIELPGMPGKISVAREETEWRFIPDTPWSSHDYRIVIRTTLEDLAGNHINRPFDVDTFNPITQSVASETVTLHVRPK
jgi:hypothetical protein